MADPNKPFWFQRRPGAFFAIFNMVALLAMDVAAANIYKLVYGYSWPSRYKGQAAASERRYRVPSKEYHHGLAPGAEFDDARWGPLQYRIRTNSLGFKDRSARRVELSSPNQRIVFIGDSFTEGIGVEYPATFAGIIERELSREDIEVFNAAAVSYSPIIYWRKIKYLLEERSFRFDELVVFLDVNDPENEAKMYYLDSTGSVRETDYESRLASAAAKPDLQKRIRNNTIVTFLILRAIRDPFMAEPERLTRQYAVNWKRSLWTMDSALYEEFGREGLEKMAFYMEKLRRLLQEYGILLTVAVYPWPDQIFHGDLHSLQVSYWEAWCRERKVRFINYFPYFVKGNTPQERLKMIERYYIPGDCHWNEAGHRLVAEIFLALRERSGQEVGK